MRDTAIESSVVTKVKGFGRYANRVMDVSDYVTPPQVWCPPPGDMCMPMSGEDRDKGSVSEPAVLLETQEPALQNTALGIKKLGFPHPRPCVSMVTDTGRKQEPPATKLVPLDALCQPRHLDQIILPRASCSVEWKQLPAPQVGTGLFPLPSPPKGTSVFVIITKMIVTENQMQGFCPEVSGTSQGSILSGVGHAA